ncbi:MAG: hypothetical protein IT236_17160 [Bacteroidia bacterium]|nr:hypothetical protein [Bacteroidia bacterium]
MKIEEINKQSPAYQALQQFVIKHKVLFNSRQWLASYPEENLVQCALFNNNNDVIGCFVYYTFKKALFRFAICAPYTPHIDLFYINPSESVVGRNTFNKEVAETLAVYFDGIKADYKNFNLPSHIIDTQPFIWKGYTSRNRYSYIIDLSKSKEELWNNLASEKRKSINKAEKDQLEISETQNFDKVYELIIKSLSRNNLGKNTEVIKNILFRFSNPQTAYSFIASANGVPIGASFCAI